MHKSGMQYSS